MPLSYKSVRKLYQTYKSISKTQVIEFDEAYFKQ